jgi:hypothetical protein
MGVLWNENGRNGWEPTFLDKSLVVLSIRTLKPVSRANRYAPELLQMAASYALIVSEKTKFRINGTPLATGLRLLEDRDLLETQAGICGFYSAEKRQIVLRFQDETGQCPRCRLKIEKGCNFVACPGCDAVYHQHEGRQCWTHGAHCVHCNTPVDLSNKHFRWTPNEL